MIHTPTACVVMMVVITISNGDDADTDRERGDHGVVTISNGDDAHTDSERGGDGCDHYQHWR